MTSIATRRWWVAAHRYLGLATLVFVFLAAFTGCVLCFRGPLDAALNADLFRRAPGRPAIDPLVAVRALQTKRPDLRVLSFPLRNAPDANLPVSVGPAAGGRPLGYDQVFVDGADGHLAGTRQIGPGWDRRHLMQGVYLLHYTLLAGTWGRWLMGVAAGGWLVGAVVGLYLTLPSRPPFWRNWLKAWTFKTTSRLGRLLLDLHQASGLWLAVGVLGLAATSVGLNFFDELVLPAVAATSPARPSPFDGPPPSHPGQRRFGFGEALDAGVAQARASGRAWRPAALEYNPDRNLYGVTFTRDGVVGYAGLGPVSYWFDGADGRFLYADDPYRDSVGRKVTRALYPLHSGKFAGVFGVALVLILGLSTIEMCVTGAYVWWVKRGPRIAARQAGERLQRTTP